MWKFESGKAVWNVVVSDIFNPTRDEIETNELHNKLLGNWEIEKERPTEPKIDITLISPEKSINMYWLPTRKVLGPHLEKSGWPKALFTRIKGELLRYKLPAPEGDT